MVRRDYSGARAWTASFMNPFPRSTATARSSSAQTDVSGNGHHGNVEGTVSSVPGQIGNALDVSGGNNFIRVTADPDVFRVGPNDAWSMAGWLKKTELGGGWQGVVTKSRDHDHWLGMWISRDGDCCAAAKSWGSSINRAVGGVT